MRKNYHLRRMIGASLAVVMAVTAVPPTPSLAQVPQEKSGGDIALDPQTHYQKLEGWGTSLCWWGNAIGSDPTIDHDGDGTSNREEIAELAFSPEYLNLNIVRYNVGGGDKAGSTIKRVEGRVPGWSKDMFGSEDGNGDFKGEAFYSKETEEMNDAGQIWMLEKANEWRQSSGDIINEVFSNSPPYYMTKSGSSTGGTEQNKENLKWDYYDDFALYLARAAKWLDNDLSKKYGTNVHYIEPLNEPDTNYWMNGSTKQEGCIFWPGNSQIEMYKKMKEALSTENLGEIKLTGTDETSLDKAIWSFNKLDAQTRKDLDVISAHTYGGNDGERNQLRKIAASYDKGLWMSEVTKGGGSHSEASHNSMGECSTKWQSEGIMSDLKKMQPTAWIAWLVADSEYECIQTDDNWGLLHYVFEKDGPVEGYHNNLFSGDGLVKEDVPEYGYWAPTKQFYTMMQYSKYLKAGYTMVEIGDNNMCAAVSPDRSEVVIVAQNFGDGTRNTSIDLGKLPNASQVELYRTSDKESCQEVGTVLNGSTLKLSLPSYSVSTYVITADGGAPLYGTEGYKKVVDCDIQVTDDTKASGASDLNKFTYSNGWNDGKWVQEKWTTNKAATATFTFQGTQAAIYGKKSLNGANLKVIVDGQDSQSVSAAAGTETRRTLIYKTPVLEYGIHTVTIAMAQEQTAAAPEIVLEYAEIINGTLEDAQVEPLRDYVTVKGIVPELPRMVKDEQSGKNLPVTWNMTADTFSVEDYTTVTVTGKLEGISAQAKAEVFVVPKNLQYFVDCNNQNSLLFEKLDSKLNLLNETPDQKKEEGTWGYLGSYGAWNHENGNQLDTGWFVQKGKTEPVSYEIPLKAGQYSVSFGFKEWWAEYDQYRPMKVVASYLADGIVKEEKLFDATVTDENPVAIGTGNFTLPEDTTVTFRVVKTGNQDPVLACFAIAEEIDHSALIAALGQARLLDRTNGDTELLKQLDEAVAAGHGLLKTSAATTQASAQAAEAIKTLLARLSANQEFTQEVLKANDYILYLANCGTKDASAVPTGYKMGLMQSLADQEYKKDSVTNKAWGYAANDEYSRIVSSGEGTEDMTDSFIYMDSKAVFDKERSGLKYVFQLPEGEYKVSVGFQNPWSSRNVNVKLEGVTLHSDLQLREGELVEKEYITSVNDGELNVMIHNPKRTNQYGDPMLSYIVVRALPEYTLELLKETVTELDEIVESDSWYESTLLHYQTVREDAVAVMESGTSTPQSIKAVYTALYNAFALLQKREPYTSISGVKGDLLYDTNGNKIQAHGGQIQQLTVDGETKYYWIGEDKTYDYRPVGGIHVYSSEDLYNWTDEGVVLRTMESKNEFEEDPYFKELYGDYSKEKKDEIFIDLDKNNCVIERPKMVYNEKNDQYVIWFHADGRTPESQADYGKAKAGIAVSDSPAGPFKLLGSYKLNYHDDPNAYHGYDGWDGRGSVRDMNLFVDDDGTGYVIYSSEGNETTFVSRLNDSYTDLEVPREEAVEGEHFTRNFIGWSREAPAMFKYDEKYYIVNSGCTGWDPNPAQYAVADHPMGPWTAKGDPCDGWESNTTFRTQSTCVFPVDRENGKYIYMGDRWYKNDLSESRYVWLPVEFMEGDRIRLGRYEDWDLDLLSSMGAAKIATEIPETFETLKALKEALPEQIDVTIGGEAFENVAVSWNEIDTEQTFVGTYEVKGILEDTGKKVMHKVHITNPDTLYFFDSGAEESSYFDALKTVPNKLKNDEPDQSYTEENKAGYLGEEDTDFGKHEGNGIFETGWWAESDKAIEYQFDLAAGEYSLLTGYQEWWNVARSKKISIIANEGEETEAILAEHEFDLQSDARDLVKALDFVVPADGGKDTPVLVRIEKTGEADPVLSFIGILTSAEVETTVAISGQVEGEDGDLLGGMEVNLFEEGVDLATSSNATPLQETKTEEEGVFEFKNLEKGGYQIEIPAQEGYQRMVKAVTADGDVKDVSFVLTKASIEEDEISVRIQQMPNKVKYRIGERLDLTGLEVVLYRNGEKDRLLFEDEFTVSDFDSSTEGAKQITVTYEEDEITCKTDFEVTVVEVQTSMKIKITKLPVKQNYGVDELIDLNGMEVRGLNIEDEPCILTEDQLEAEYDFGRSGKTTVTIRHKVTTGEDGDICLSDTFSVMVYEQDGLLEPWVEGIQIVENPLRMSYGLNEEFLPEGIKVEKTVSIQASPSNAAYKEEIPVEELDFDYQDFEKAGKYKVAVAYYVEDESGEERRLEDTLTVTVTKAESVIADDIMEMLRKRLETDLSHGEFLTKGEKQYAFERAIQTTMECVDSYGALSDSGMKVLKRVEALLLENFTNITAGVWHDAAFGNVSADGLALSADVYSDESQSMKMQLKKSKEKLPSKLANTAKSQFAMDITLLSGEDEIQPKIPVRIAMDIPTGIEKTNLVIYHNHDGNWKTLHPTIRGNQMIFTVSELSVFVAANTKESTKPSYDGDSESQDSGPAYTIPGNWKKDAVGWWYQRTDGTCLASTWGRINGQWYYFNGQGYMVTGWLLDGGQWYYLQTDGKMAASEWILWQEKWYYLTWNGAMAAGIRTPDGHQVGNDGVWIP